jgi:serine/threonine protein kinase
MKNKLNKNSNSKNSKFKINKKTLKNKNKKKISKGGKVLASGGFGCVFMPALRCENKKTRKRNGVSKLMTTNHATKEYNEIVQIKEKLKTIKKYTDYFLVNDISICKPALLTKSDLIDFTEKCSALQKDDHITLKNINNSLDKMMILNMKNGGLPVDDFIFNAGHFSDLYELNHSLIGLLKNGIIEMNKKNIYHCDIKDSNILVEKKQNSLKTRLIDWGLATVYVPFHNNPFPNTWINRPLQYNVPFSVIIFTDAFIEKYTKYTNDGLNKKEEEGLSAFVSDYLHFWIDERGMGHLKLIDKIINILLDQEKREEEEEERKETSISQITMEYITKYIVNILIHFTIFREDGTWTLNMREYLDHVFIDNVDVWGFVSTYLAFLESLHENKDELEKPLIECFDIIRNLFMFIYSPSHSHIPIDKKVIFNYLNHLSDLYKIEASRTNTTKNKDQLSMTKSESVRSKGITGETFVPTIFYSKNSKKSDF